MTRKNDHYLSLEKMYTGGPINQIYNPKILVEKGCAEIEIDVKDKFFHSAGAVHGSVYFKMLDDAAFFAANSLEKQFFMLTASFTTYLLRPITSGIIKSVGKVASISTTQFLSESIAYNSSGKEIAQGSGIFVKSKVRLVDVPGYSSE
jgi:uncharacterized protein (TIGR00369 family)